MDKIIELLQNGTISLPKIFLNKYKELQINEKEFILLMYLMNYNNAFNPKQIALEIGSDYKEVLELVNSLCEKNLVQIDVRTENQVKNEYINIDKLYNKLAFLVMNHKTKEEPKNLFSTFEKEFGRTLSPMEYELINAWKDKNFSEELIIEALKEAVLNGVTNLRYIDKILYDWNRKGIKNPKDIEKRKVTNEKKEKLFKYDWLNDNE